MNKFNEYKGQLRRMWTCLSCGTHGIVVADTDAIAAQLAHDGHLSASPKCDHLRLHFDDEEEAQRLQVLGVQGLKVAAWSPGDANVTLPTQVHLLITVASLNSILMTRLKTREAVDDLIDALAARRDEVWPLAGSREAHVNIFRAERWDMFVERGNFVRGGEHFTFCATCVMDDDYPDLKGYADSFYGAITSLLDVMADTRSDDDLDLPLDGS